MIQFLWRYRSLQVFFSYMSIIDLSFKELVHLIQAIKFVVKSYSLLLFSRSLVSDSVTPWTAVRQVSLSFTISWSLLKLMSIELVIAPNNPILCHPLLFLPSIFPSIRVFTDEPSLCIRWPKYWSFRVTHNIPLLILLMSMDQ